jgi:ATP-dependent Clp protease ATP-binding subunit ClpA
LLRNLLLGIIQLPMGESIGSHILTGLGITVDKIRAIMPSPETSVSSQIDLSESMKRTLEHAATIAQKRGEQRLSSAHLLAGVMEEADTLYVLERLDLTKGRVTTVLHSLQIWTNEH